MKVMNLNGQSIKYRLSSLKKLFQEAASEFEKRTVQRFQHLADKRKMLKKQRTFKSQDPDSEVLPRNTE